MTDRGDGVVAVAMYPFDAVRAGLDQLWPLIHRHLGFGPASLSWDLDLQASWGRSDLLLGQTCGWPLVSQLGDSVEVVGVFDPTVPEGRDGTYRSVIVSRSPAPLAEQLADPRLRVMVNNDDSLSGFVSLRTVFADHGRAVDAPIFTGSHLASVRGLADGEADLASIDAVSWALICESEPRVAAGLHVVGQGPRVPCLPLIAAAGLPPVDGRPVVEHLRAAIGDACGDPAAAEPLAAIHARGFVAKSATDYAPLRGLAGAL
jgi:ABC-type phosphate/phosphonate transport system substrate-binding protein